MIALQALLCIWGLLLWALFGAALLFRRRALPDLPAIQALCSLFWPVTLFVPRGVLIGLGETKPVTLNSGESVRRVGTDRWDRL